MADDVLPDLTPETLSRLVLGMTTEEVEAIVGRFHRPNVIEGREYFAWIGEGGMLRAKFDGPGRTLSAASLDAAEGKRILDLGSDSRRRKRQATIMRTWYCVPCRQRYRQPQSGRAMKCEICKNVCERMIVGIRVPSPSYPKAWDTFWAKYRAEMEFLEADERGELRQVVTLELFGIRLPKSGRRKRSTSE